MTVEVFRVFVPWLWNKMAFMKRKTVKFAVDLQICQLSDVPLVNAVVFAKLRLLEGGSFEDITERVEVKNHCAAFNKRSDFSCRISCEQATGTLEKCLCRISIRKEQKGGKSFYKLGYVDVNLSEYAGSGIEGISRTYLLNGYTTNQRLDNSKVCIKVVMSHQSADPYFRVPRLSTVGMSEEIALNPEAFKANDSKDTDSEEYLGQHKQSLLDGQYDCASASSSAIDDLMHERKITHANASIPTNNVPLRRFSQDRLAQRIQTTRFDPDNVVDKVIAECRFSEENDAPSHHGLSLDKLLDKHGRPLSSRYHGKRTSYTSDQDY